MEDKELGEEIAIKFCEALDIDFYTPYGRELGNAFANSQIMPLIEKAGWKSPTVKVCLGCPDRFEGCVKLAENQIFPKELLADFHKQSEVFRAGWRKVKLEVTAIWPMVGIAETAEPARHNRKGQ